ncbi:hypothetical protein GSI_08777 [Ganoderma sinense ZZ0214-1]|uniref:Uncharacterized protein n=1 Tax=Ganoderma sinense ZZ0214-1 TaxID=1077348 RepID=A0A2G8S4N1_9APHY|nr:hypothetical protein GSI_08777 [Ganoderma sinense ZZ0214-1]
MVPDVRVIFKTDEEFYTITVTDKRTWRFYLRFTVDHEFWEVARIVVEAKLEQGIRGSRINDLIRGALDTVPTVVGRPSPAPPYTAANVRPSSSDAE